MVDQTVIHRWRRKWQRKLLLQSWTIDLEFQQKDQDVPGETVFYRAIPDPKYLKVVIQIFPATFQLSPEEAERRFAHELLHSLTAEMSDIAARRHTTEKEIEDADERLTEWFTNIVWRMSGGGRR